MLPDVPLDADVAGLVEVEAVGGSLFVRADRDGRTHLAEVSPEGSLLGQNTFEAASGDVLTASLDRRQMFECSTRYGVSFTRYDRTGTRVQRSVSLSPGEPSGTCAAVAIATGVLIAWSHSEDGTTRWTRVGCPPPP